MGQYVETISRKDLIGWLTCEFGCSERSAADNLSILVQGHWLQRTRDNEDGRKSSYTITERGRFILTHRQCSRIVSKAKKRQAGESGAMTRLLFCDLTATVVEAHLQDPHRVADYRTLLRCELEPQIEENYDAIALVEQRGWSKELKMGSADYASASAWLVSVKSRARKATLRHATFGSQDGGADAILLRTSSAYSPERKSVSRRWRASSVLRPPVRA